MKADYTIYTIVPTNTKDIDKIKAIVVGMATISWDTCVAKINCWDTGSVYATEWHVD